MKIALTGATGFIGRRLMRRLLTDQHELRVLGRGAGSGLPSGVRFHPWDPAAGEPPAESLDGAEAVIHLAGEPVAQRWTPEVKQRIRDSRVTGTRHLVQALSTLRSRPRTLVCASAIGYYGDRGDEILTEQSKPGRGYLPRTCVEWEQQADLAESLGMRLVKVRIGVVLGAEGGALKQMLTPFKLGAGGPVGSGKQWMSWIHADDMVDLLRFAAVLDSLSGPVNGVAPEPQRNAEFSKALGRALHRPAIVPAPAFALKLMFGEMAEVVLGSQRVLPKAAEAAGFTFRFPELDAALRDAVTPAD